MFQVSVRVFQGCSVLKVHCYMSFITASKAEGGLVLNISWWVGIWPYSFSVLTRAYDLKTEILFRDLQNKLLFKKYCKAGYIHHHMCFVNVQVPCPHSHIYVKLCTSRLCIKMSSFLFVSGCAMPRILYLSCEVPFPVWTPDDISGLISVVPWLSREELSKRNCR